MPNKRVILTVVALLVVINVTLGIRWFIVARSTPSSASCINNLRQIDSAKEQWALEKQSDTNAAPTWDEVQNYLRGNLVCPSGGTYVLERIGKPATCSLGGPSHTSPSDRK